MVWTNLGFYHLPPTTKKLPFTTGSSSVGKLVEIQRDRDKPKQMKGQESLKFAEGITPAHLSTQALKRTAGKEGCGDTGREPALQAQPGAHWVTPVRTGSPVQRA